MASSAHMLKRFQLIPEVTPGTILAATWQLVGETEVTYPITREFESFPRGVYAPYTGGGVDLRNATMIAHQGNATYEELTHMLAATYVSPTLTGAGPYVYTGTRSMTAPPTLKSYSCEMVENDGSGTQLEKLAAYLTGTDLELTIARGAIAKVKWNAFARQAANGSAATGLAALTGRSPIASDLFKFYMDDTWAGLGGTQKSSTIRTATLKVAGGAKPGYTLDGRTTLDFTKLDFDPISGSLSITCELDAYAKAEIAKYEAHALRFIRLIATDGTKIAKFDMCAVHTAEPKFSSDNGIRLATFTLSLEYDPTSAKVFLPVITNSLATLSAV